MRTQQQHKKVRLAGITLLLTTLLTSAQAEQVSGPDILASGVVAFDETKDSCTYAASIEGAVRHVDQTYADQYGTEWEVAKREGKASLVVLRNLPTMMGSAGSIDDCKTLGIPVGDMLALSLVIIKPDPEIGREATRLPNGGGKALPKQSHSSKLEDQSITPKGKRPSGLESAATRKAERTQAVSTPQKLRLPSVRPD